MSAPFLITPSLGAAVVTSADAARITRDELLAQASEVKLVKDRLDADDATVVLKRLKDFTRGIEAQRTSAKAPALEIGKKIDGLAKELAASVDAEASRISRVIGAYEIEEKQKAEKARLEAEAETSRIAREAEQQARNAMRTASSEEAGTRAADTIVEKAQEKIIAVKQQAVASAPVRNLGTSVREDVCFEVTDIKALYADSPHLVTLEPNGTAIRAIIKANPNLKLPGLRHWREAKLNVR